MKIIEIIKELEKESSTLAKENILKTNESSILKKILFYTYNSLFNYGLTRKTIEKEFKKISEVPKIEINEESFFELLDTLNSSNINNELRKQVAIFLLNANEENREIMIRVICKNLQAGINTKLINKVFNNLIPIFEVQLAKKYEPKYIKNGEIFYITEKLDGIRAVNLFNKNQFKYNFISRQGKMINGLKDLEFEMQTLRNYLIKKNAFFTDSIFDGELIRINNENLTSDENYTETVSIVNSKLEEKQNIEYCIFDIITNKEFFNGESEQVYSERRKLLNIVNNAIVDLKLTYIKIVPILYKSNDINVIPFYLDLMVKNNKEGIMINRDTNYKCKRNDGILKVKEMYTMDLKVIGYEEGQGEFEGLLGALIVDFKGMPVNVGSGFSKEEREKLWKEKDSLIERIIEVKYFRVSKNKNGEESLRFPIFKCLREKNKEISYE